MAEKVVGLQKKGNGNSVPLKDRWGIKGNSSTVSSSVSISGLTVGKKYLAVVQATFTTGSFNPVWTGATQQWQTAIGNWGSSVLVRNYLVCIVPTATTVTLSTGVNSNWVIVASEDSPMPT